MKCEKCGAEIPENSAICPVCGGSDVAVDNEQNPQGQEQLNKNSAEEAESINNNTGEVGAAEAEDEFEIKYSNAFEGSSNSENEYKIDEELKRKREARYDESFSNMTNDEKIKALEAARLARKEKRDKKLTKNKKENGGLFALLRGEGKSEEVKPAVADETDTAEEVQDISKTQLMDTDEVKRELKRAKEKKHGKKAALTPKMGIVLGCIVAVLVVAIIVASVNMASNVANGEPEAATVYAKGNALYSHYSGKDVQLSSNFIASEYEESTEETPDEIKEKDLIHNTADGTAAYFIDTADMNEQKGALNYVKSGKKNSLAKIAEDVYYNVVLSEDGTGVLYLTGADSFGMNGTLNYWSAATEKSTKLGDNVNTENFMFAGNGSRIVYICNYNTEHYVGDLHMASVVKGEVSAAGKLDSDVYKVFGTNSSGNTAVYAKNYNKETLCFDVYIMRDNVSNSVLVADGSRCKPIIAKTSDNMFVGGSYENYYQTLYYASLESGQKEKIASGLTELIEMSRDEQAVVFRKANASGTAFDYFYANQMGTDEQELAMNVTVLDDEEHKRVCQFDINDDFTKAVFIQGYDTERESGALFTVSINNGNVSSDKKISDTAYSCNLTPDGSTVRYADSYDIAWNLVNLNSYNGESSTILAKEVGAGAFTFDKAGNYIVYAKNYSLENKTGDVYCVDNKGKTREVVKGVSTYGLKGNGEIVYSSKADGDNIDLYFTAPSGKGAKNIDKNVSRVVSY